jgi:hypothetical protein
VIELHWAGTISSVTPKEEEEKKVVTKLHRRHPLRREMQNVLKRVMKY